MKDSIFAFVIILFYFARGEIYYPKSHKPVPPQQNCPLSAEIAFLVDVNSHPLKNLVSVQDEIMEFSNAFHRYSESRLGVASFSDKPIPPLGPDWSDGLEGYCLKVHARIDKTRIGREIETLNHVGCRDYPQAQFDAMLRAVKGRKFGWKENSLSPSGRIYVKALFVVTDSMAHTSPDAAAVVKALQLTTPIVPNTIDVNSSLIAEDVNAECGNMEYPTLKQVGDAFREEGILPVFLIAPAGYLCGPENDSICPYPEFRSLAQENQNSDYRDPMKGMDLLYKSYLEEMNITGIIQHLGWGFQGLLMRSGEAFFEMHDLPRHCTPINRTATTTMSTTMTTTMTTTMPTTIPKYR